MPLTIMLVRHAKSSWDDPGLRDFDRPLNGRGFRDAPEMGKRLARRNYKADVIISSPAVRAITTAEIIAGETGVEEGDILREPAIYEAGLDALVNVVTGIDDSYECVMLVGHNPGFTDLCNYLGNAGIDNLPTCGMAQIEFHVDTWKAVTMYGGKLVSFDYPKKVPG